MNLMFNRHASTLGPWSRDMLRHHSHDLEACLYTLSMAQRHVSTSWSCLETGFYTMDVHGYIYCTCMYGHCEKAFKYFDLNGSVCDWSSRPNILSTEQIMQYLAVFHDHKGRGLAATCTPFGDESNVLQTCLYTMAMDKRHVSTPWP